VIFNVVIGVALHRPPRIDEFRLVQVEAADRNEARLIACQIAAVDSVMPVWDGWPDDVGTLPEGWLR
jgi:hypothetical protein